MSLNSELDAAFTEAQGQLADATGKAASAPGNFTIHGDPKPYTGVPDASRRGDQLEIGGRLVTLALTISATIDQFAAEPPRGSLLTSDGIVYKLITVTHDAYFYTFALEQPNQ